MSSGSEFQTVGPVTEKVQRQGANRRGELYITHAKDAQVSM